MPKKARKPNLTTTTTTRVQRAKQRVDSPKSSTAKKRLFKTLDELRDFAKKQTRS